MLCADPRWGGTGCAHILWAQHHSQVLPFRYSHTGDMKKVSPAEVNCEMSLTKSSVCFRSVCFQNLSQHSAHCSLLPITRHQLLPSLHMSVYVHTIYNRSWKEDMQQEFCAGIAAENTIIKYLPNSSVLLLFFTGLPKYLGLHYLLAFILKRNMPRYHLADNTISMALIADRIYFFFSFFVESFLHNLETWPPWNI